MRIGRMPGDEGRTDFNVRMGEHYLATLTRTHHLRNVDPNLVLV